MRRANAGKSTETDESVQSKAFEFEGRQLLWESRNNKNYVFDLNDKIEDKYQIAEFDVTGSLLWRIY